MDAAGYPAADLFWCPAPRDVVMAHGPDALSYLHSQLSQEIRDLDVGEARWTFVLQPAGKVDVLARVLRSGDSAFVLDVDAGSGDALLARLLRFRIRVKVDVERIPWHCIAVRGAGAAEAAARAITAAGGAVAVPGWWGSDDAADLLGPSPVPPDGVRAASADELEAARVAAGWPAMGPEIGATTIPGETGVVSVAVSFTKGCYPGQELVERMDSRAATAPRLLRRVRLSGPASPGDAVTIDGRDAGRITSVAGGLALALVGRAVDVPTSVVVAGHPATVDAVATP
jgi:folate-binding protein YgfZ